MAGNPVITLTTDIGWRYAAQMKGRILSLLPEARLVDIAHDVSPQDVREGAFVLYAAVSHFPRAVHIAVVDPGVGTRRRALMVETEGGFLVGPDNGVLLPAARRLGLQEVYVITGSPLPAADVSSTFHGRDIFAPVAVHLARGVGPPHLGEACADYVDLDFGHPAVGTSIEGRVIYVDHFGNLITNIPGVLVDTTRGGQATVQVGDTTVEVPLVRSYGYARRGQLLLTVSSADLVEIACREGSAQRQLSVGVGDRVVVEPPGTGTT
ncbi:MAG: S-adenosyl-l-methionine hydroxide adenosyltransferase family protein [Candidatus Thermoplasmatota archaeon]|nr:S-adenosyl-l-methionine hydroxide adenosyltransferase family protein [Candidatus Thermoplasmatota archaeon]MDD5778017.1 S-adenosyl-l-methionine hydroxide adenosyltransferase family protein [Candidatus Thermoplasmatota archaeon]